MLTLSVQMPDQSGYVDLHGESGGSPASPRNSSFCLRIKQEFYVKRLWVMARTRAIAGLAQQSIKGVA